MSFGEKPCHPSLRAVLVGVFVSAVALSHTGSAESPPATSQPAPRPQDKPIPETNGPITYYVEHCARCHGDISAAYVGVKKPKHRAELRKVIEDMATGPANAPLDKEGLDEQAKLHEAMFGDKPYAWIDRSQNPAVVEKLENTEVRLVYGDTVETPRRTDDYRAEFNRRDGKLVVTKLKKQ